MTAECCPNSLRDISHFEAAVRQFRSQYYERDPEMMQALSKGQAPATLIIACSDSRVDTGVLLGAKPGELFTVRNIANLVPPYEQGAGLHGTGAAIEYAVRDVAVDHIIVLGHASCGGIKAVLAAAGGKPIEREFVADWVSMAMDATELYLNPDESGVRHKVSVDLLKENPGLVERASVTGSLHNLLTYPWVKERYDAGKLSLHGWWFDIETGDLWKSDKNDFRLMPAI
ncbi:carbonic anhydrase [Pollutimonas subterranea]|uniref:Carbonic anhydrase n=1 Tax=Pollutimonas subterranea TaxID=2045210 RepID=A0A2N4U8F7_9BURK|nr:carbonic anhydrase [Pollutimonas subterranea]PLC51303.1 carbonic anhydrase [Pollutimonas subterranea]